MRIFLVGLLLCVNSAAFAAPTEDQVRKVMNEQSIPNWKKLTEQVIDFRKSPPVLTWVDFWKNLDEKSKVGFGTNALTTASSPQSTDELFADATWLRWKILADSADGRYSYVYAYLLGLMQAKDGNYLKEAAVFLYDARLAMAIDGAYCADSSSPETISMGYETQKPFGMLLEKLAVLTPKEIAIAQLEAVGIEELRGERAPFENLCTHGTQTQIKAMRDGRQFQKVPPSEVNSGNINATDHTYTIDATGIKPDLIPENEWKIKRRKILDKVISNATGLL